MRNIEEVNLENPLEKFGWFKGGCFIEPESKTIIQDSNKKELYYPFTSNSQIFREFVNIVSWKSDYQKRIIDFTNSYGLLGLARHPRIIEERNRKKSIDTHNLMLDMIEYVKKVSIDVVSESLPVTIDFLINAMLKKPHVNPIVLLRQINDQIKIVQSNKQETGDFKKTRFEEEHYLKSDIYENADYREKETLEDWEEEIARFNWFLTLIAHIQSDNDDNLRLFIIRREREILQNIPANLQGDWIKVIEEEIEGINHWSGITLRSHAKYFLLETELNKDLEGVSPQYDSHDRMLKYRCPSLLAVMYTMLLSDLTKGKANTVTFSFCKFCDKPILKSRPNNCFCNNTCKNAYKAKKGRERKKMKLESNIF